MMEEPTILPEQHLKPSDGEVKKTSLLRTLVSLTIFIAAYYYLFKSWFSVLVLVAVIIIHESGHFIAMKYFGYKGVQMTFVPFVGAYVSGQASNLSRKNKLLVLLAGPLPGILAGTVLFYLHVHFQNHTLLLLAAPFLILNGFNLLPVFPLDGGQYFRALFFEGSRMIQAIFLLASLAALLFLVVQAPGSWYLLVLVALVIVRLFSMYRVGKIRKLMDEAGIDYAASYDDLSDDTYFEMRKVLIENTWYLRKHYDSEAPSENEQPMIKEIESILVAPYHDDLSTKGKVLFALAWLISFSLPVLLFLYHTHRL